MGPSPKERHHGRLALENWGTGCVSKGRSQKYMACLTQKGWYHYAIKNPHVKPATRRCMYVQKMNQSAAATPRLHNPPAILSVSRFLDRWPISTVTVKQEGGGGDCATNIYDTGSGLKPASVSWLIT